MGERKQGQRRGLPMPRHLPSCHPLSSVQATPPPKEAVPVLSKDTEAYFISVDGPTNRRRIINVLRKDFR